jgi:poly-gamma-glutamate capsule biosynthesis protein CapA/YwtB (metallophosphatase superfamily)
MNDFSRRDFLHSAAQFATASAISPYARLLEESGPRAITLAAVGDCMIARQISNLPPDEFLPLAKIIQAADVSFGNFEMTLADDNAPPAYHDSCAYVHLRADLPGNRVIADELKWAGFKMLGMANNHAMDYGAPGLLSTMQKLDDAGLAHAGTGCTLAEARSPAYYDSPKGRIALVACASTFPYGAFAADGNGEVAPRAGLNPCRVQTTYQLTPGQLKELKTVGAALGLNPGSSDTTYTFLTHKFITGASNEVLTSGDPLDVAALTSAVRRASRNADLTLFGIHAHEGARSAEIPAQFLQPLAHACIDAGANAFIGHGPHVLRGIEIYKRRPIFYSLGNFIFHGESAKQIPPEIYQVCGATGSDPSDVFDKVLQGFSGDAYWNSVVAVPAFQNGELTELKLHPIILQSELSRPRRGTPMLADAEAGRKIIAKLSQLSEPYGTRISYEGGAGVVQL